MSLFVANITIVSATAALRRNAKRLLKNALLKGMQFYRRSIHPQHFTVAGARKYGYRRRTRKYREAKKRVKGHSRPLVWSGESERRSSRSRITGTASRVRMFINAPNLNFSPKGGEKRIDMLDEVTRVTNADARAVFGVVRKRFHERRRRLRGIRRTHRIAA